MKENKKILIIEDEKPLAHALELKLTHAGFQVKVVFDGEDGIAQLQKEAYALVLLDLVMPKMDGFTVLENLQAKKIKTPVIVLSNLSQAEDKNRVKALGVKEFFIKSNSSIASIVERVTQLLN